MCCTHAVRCNQLALPRCHIKPPTSCPSSHLQVCHRPAILAGRQPPIPLLPPPPSSRLPHKAAFRTWRAAWGGWQGGQRDEPLTAVARVFADCEGNAAQPHWQFWEPAGGGRRSGASGKRGSCAGAAAPQPVGAWRRVVEQDPPAHKHTGILGCFALYYWLMYTSSLMFPFKLLSRFFCYIHFSILRLHLPVSPCTSRRVYLTASF